MINIITKNLTINLVIARLILNECMEVCPPCVRIVMGFLVSYFEVLFVGFIFDFINLFL